MALRILQSCMTHIAPPNGGAVHWIIIFFLAFAAVSTLASPPAHAVQPDEILSDRNLEARARELSRGLRCLVCQNQSIDDSDAPLARDLRILVRERLKAGDTDVQVVDFLVARYGEFVLLKPRFAAHTLLLWLLPPMILLGGGLVLFATIRRRHRANSATANSEQPLTADEQKKLGQFLRE